MCHLGPIQPRHTLDRLRGRPTRIRHGLRSNVDCLSLFLPIPSSGVLPVPPPLLCSLPPPPAGAESTAWLSTSCAGGPSARRRRSASPPWPERVLPQLRELAARRPRLASPRLHCERPARARAEGAEGEEWRRRWGRLASAVRRREQWRANAGRHGPAEDRLDGGARLRPSASRRSSGGHCEDGGGGRGRRAVF